MKKTHIDYENSIKSLHDELKDYPESKTLQNRLSYRLSKWASLLDIEIHVANNENTPWTSTEIGYPTVPMVDKKTSGNYNVGDYQAFIKSYDTWCGVLVERKGATRSKNLPMQSCDLYNTFSKEDNRRRFYAEVERFHRDSRFNMMILITECSHGEFLRFKPSFNGKNYNKCNYGMNVPSRRATIAKLYNVGCSVFFAGTRHHAIEMYQDFIIQWIRQNYVTILNLKI